MTVRKSAFCAWVALASMPAAAQGGDPGTSQPTPKPEVATGVLQHGANFHPLGARLFFEPPPPNVIYEGGEEDGTADIQLVYRTAPLRWALKPRLTAKLQVNTDGRTSFASVGAEWRQHILRGRIYGQIGIGVTVHDGYRFTPDPFAVGISPAEAQRRYQLYISRISFGSRVMFNPNASLGMRLGKRWAAELAWEHFSHRQIFNKQNPGIDNVGFRLVRTFK